MCPYCRSHNFKTVPLKGWMRILPVAKMAHCRHCKRNFLSFLIFTSPIEQRKSPRYQVPNTLLVRFRAAREQFAKIQNISSGGLNFSYNFDLQKLSSSSLNIDIYNCEQGTYLENLPVRILSNRIVIQKMGDKSTTIMKNAAQFERLNRVQYKLLEDFIDRYAIKEI